MHLSPAVAALATSLSSVSLAAPSPWGRGHGPPSHGPGAGCHAGTHSTWDLKSFESLVVFGDSYSDDSRLGYFIENDGEAPPVGWVDPVNPKAADGGRIWGQYVLQYSSATHLYNYAVSGAVCSNDITPRYFSLIDAPFPAVAQYEVPAFLADSAYVKPNGKKFIQGTPDNTVYAIWIGTNDLGNYAFIQDAQVAGTNLTTYVDCVYDQLHKVYDNGGRYFVLFNNAPLQFAPEYAGPPNDVGANQYWPDKPRNHTLIEQRMLEQVVTVNEIFEYRTPFEVVLQGKWPGARFAVFDVNGLMTDIHANPAQYLNGSAPLNVDGYVNHCNTTGGDCEASSSPDSFLWYDELHPSEQAERVIAREFVNVVEGSSRSKPVPGTAVIQATVSDRARVIGAGKVLRR